MTGRFMHGLGEWNSNTPESLKYTASATVANGGSFYLIDRQLPDGSLEERAYKALEDTFTFLDARRDVLSGTRHVPEVGVLNSYDHIMGPDLRFYPDSDTRKKRMENFEGVVRMFIEHGRHFTGLNVERFVECGSDYRALIVPEQEFLDQQTKAALQSYAENGGKLLVSVTGEPEAVDADILTLAGVELTGEDCGHYSHIDTAPPTLVRGHFTAITHADDVEVLHSRLAPFATGKFGHGFAPPTDTPAGPAVTSRKVGKGEVILVAFPLFKSYQHHQVPALAHTLFRLLDRLVPDPYVKVTTPAQVEMSAVRKGDDLIVHLVNHSGRERLGYYYYPVTEYMPEIRDITVAIRDPGHAVDVVAVPGARQVRCEREEGYLVCDVPRLAFLESLRVAGYFGK
jgi:hypothetical protein